MKRLSILAVSVLVSLFMMSCLNSGQSDYTPAVRSSVFIRNHADTLSLKANDSGVYTLDTIYVGDTVNYVVACATYSNQLLSLVLSKEGSSVKHTIVKATTIEYALAANSDTTACQLYFNPGYNGVSIPVELVAEHHGTTALIYTVSSESKFSPADMKLSVIVEDKQ